MYVSLNWLKDYVKIPKKLTPEELGLKLTMHTVEIDSVIKQADKFKNVIVGKILEVKKHPNADKLQLAKVRIGSFGKLSLGKEELSIVCGAPNIKAGQLVPVALPGAVLPNGMEIREVEVRGEVSQGMLCAEDEIGLGPDHNGIMILSSKAKPGQLLSDYLGLSDVIFEVDNKSITNRPDLWGHYGMSREVAAFLGLKLKEYTSKPGMKESLSSLPPVDAKVEDFALCPRYMAIGMRNIKVGPSPKWMSERLVAAGMRPINNIVDITNYIMLEFGQPMHAFDRSKVDRIIVRHAKKGEMIETLDMEKRNLDENMLVIASSERPLAVAGVMGGADSEIGPDTTEIIFESANFSSISVRKTSQKLGLRTESSMRYEKSLDPNLCETGLLRAVELVKETIPGAEVSIGLKDEQKFSLFEGPIELNIDWLNMSLGKKLAEREISHILKPLGFEFERQGKVLSVKVPSWRGARDVSTREDLLEEIARIYGYDNIERSLPKVEMRPPALNEVRQFERKIKSILSMGASLSEVENYSFVGEDQIKKLGLDPAMNVRLANPIASNQTLLRANLAPNLVANIKTNQARYKEIGLFELGNVFMAMPGEINRDRTASETLPYQENRLGMAISVGSSETSFDRAKGIIAMLFDSLGMEAKFTTTEIVPAWANPALSAAVIIGNEEIGCVCALDVSLGRSSGLKKEAALVELSMKKLFKAYQSSGSVKFSEFEKFPPVVRDLAFVVSSKIPYNNIKDEIVNSSSLVKKVELFDVFEGGNLGEGLRNLAFHIIYQADRTMTSAEVDDLQKVLIEKMEKMFEAKIRNF